MSNLRRLDRRNKVFETWAMEPGDFAPNTVEEKFDGKANLDTDDIG